jgi:hypothetical protein
MPDAARLVAALCLVLIAFIVTGQIIPLFDEGTDFGYFLWVNMGIGFLSGWIIMGKRAGRGITAAINNGVTGVVAMVFWGLFVQGVNEMVRLAMRNRYDGPFEAILAIFELSARYGMMMIQYNILITLLIGSVVAGLAAEYAWRTWR